MVHNGRRRQLSVICILAVVVFRTLVNGKDEVLVKSCPTDKSSWDTAARRKECELEAGTDYVYHCLKNKGNQLVEACLFPSWIESGICPVLFESGDFGSENCISKYDQVCPTDNIRSNRLYLYPICFDTSVPEGNNSTNVSKGVDDGNSSLVNKHNRMKGLGHAPVVTALSGALLSGMSFWILYLYYKRKYIKRKETDMEHGIEEEKERLSKNAEYSYNHVPVVQLTAYTDGLRILEERGILIITGRTGSGKTTAMEQIYNALLEETKDWKVKTISCIENNNGNEKWIITLDDCFGKFVTNPAYKKRTVDKLNKLFSWITESVDNRKAVLTMSENEFLNFSVMFSLVNEKIENCRLCLDKLNTEEKDEILKNIFIDPRFDTSMHKKVKMKLKEVDKESVAFAALGWPLICRLVSIPEVALNTEYFSKNPLQCLVSIFVNLQSDNQQLYCAMIYALFKGGDVSRMRSKEGGTSVRFLRTISEKLAPAMLPPKSDNQGSANKSMSNTEELDFLCHKLSGIFIQSPHYFLRTGSEIFQFHHTIFELALLCLFYEQFPKLTLECLDFDLVSELFRPKDYVWEFYELDVFYLCNFEDNCSESVIHEKKAKEQDMAKDREKTVPKWKFVLEESLFSSVIEKVRQGQRVKDFKEHPLMKDKAFTRQLKRIVKR